jgi:hypothetical protein
MKLLNGKEKNSNSLVEYGNNNSIMKYEHYKRVKTKKYIKINKRFNMNKILLFLALISTCIYPQNIIIYRIETPSQIDIAKFVPELKFLIKEEERVIYLLPKTLDDVFIKTFHHGDTAEIGNLLTYILRIRKQEVKTSTASFDNAEFNIIQSIKKYYGPSVQIRRIILSDCSYETNPKTLQPEAISVPPVKHDIIDPNGEPTLFNIIKYVFPLSIIFGLILFLYVKSKRVLKEHNRTNNIIEQCIEPLCENPGTSVSAFINKPAIDKDSFFKKQHILNSWTILLWFIFTTGMMAQNYYYLDNTIKPELRPKVLQVVKNSAEFGNKYYLFGDSVRYICKLKKISDLDTIAKSNNNKDHQTSFQSLLQFTFKHKGLHIIITDGKPDFFNEDLPEYTVDSVKTAGIMQNTQGVQTTVKSSQDRIWLTYSVPGLAGIAVLIILWLLIISVRKKNPSAGPDLAIISYKYITGEIKLLQLPVRITGNQNKMKVFETITPDFKKYDLRIINTGDKLMIEEINITKKLNVEESYVVE